MCEKMFGFLPMGYLMTVLTTTQVQGICTWPSSFANTVWTDSVQGALTFTNQTMSGWEVSTKDLSMWQCHSTDWLISDSLLILRTVGTFEAFSRIYYGYLCIQLVSITDHSYRYYVKNPIQENLGNDTIYIDTAADVLNFDTLCSNTTEFLADLPALSEYRVMIETGYETSAKINCPYVFLGKYDYVHTDQTGSSTCSSSVDTLDTCTNFSEIAFTYETCATRVAYSASPTVWCVDTVPVDGANYITVYNGNDDTVDNTTTFRFTCIAVSADNTVASVSPKNCKRGQSPDTLPSGTPAATLDLAKAESCASCPGLSVSGGSVSFSTDGAVTMASYECSQSYTLVGSANRTCQSDLSWSSEAPICEADSSASASDTNKDQPLLPVVIALSVVAVVLIIALAAALVYIYKQSKTLNSYQESIAGWPRDSETFRNEPASSQTSQLGQYSDEEGVSPSKSPSDIVSARRSRPTTTSTTITTSKLRLELVKEATSSSLSLDPGVPAPWTVQKRQAIGDIIPN